MGRVIYVSPAAYPRPRHDRKRDRLVNRRRVIMQMEEQPGCDEGKGEKEKKKEKKNGIERYREGAPGLLSIYNRRVRSEITGHAEALTVTRVSRARIRLIGVARAACKVGRRLRSGAGGWGVA